MPCDQIRYQQVEYKAANQDLLKAALVRAGYEVTEIGAGLRFWHKTTTQSGSFANGKFTVVEGTDVDAIKREYAAEAVERAQKKFGWAVKKTADNKYRLTRRTF